MNRRDVWNQRRQRAPRRWAFEHRNGLIDLVRLPEPTFTIRWAIPLLSFSAAGLLSTGGAPPPIWRIECLVVPRYVTAVTLFSDLVKEGHWLSVLAAKR